MSANKKEKKVEKVEKVVEVKPEEVKVEPKKEVDEVKITIPKPVEKKKDVIGVVTAALLNVRTGPGFNFSNFLPCPAIVKNTKVKILKDVINEKEEKWYKIQLMEPEIKQQVYVKAEFIKI